MIVADADLTAYRLIRGTRSEVADAVYLRDGFWVAPENHRAEVLNVISKNIRGRSISMDQGIVAFNEAQRLIEYRSQKLAEIDLLKLSVELNTSAYDCIYVSLARHLGVRVVTGDAGLSRRAPDVAVLMEDFAAGK